ncbi:MAG: phosphate acyltransferase PlsX [Chloroflexi bacterium]|nr:MAG: phosphate acyltransferase PlsX [Chloroflexota bacterium]
MTDSGGIGSWVGIGGKARMSQIQESGERTAEARMRIRIAVDAVGGDYAPSEVVRGAVQAARELGVDIILTGPRAEVAGELASIGADNLPIELVDAPDVIRDSDNPILAVMRKPKNSLAIAAKLVKQGKADAMMSAGSTGAVMLSAYRYLGTLPGVDRPIIGGPFIQLAPNTFVLDLGANVGCQAYHLLNFAVAGSVFVQKFLGIENPTVGLLNVGAEEGKGNEVVKEAYSLLRESGLNFVGNVEGMDIPLGKANVIVCDGFVGNILLKFSEGLGKSLGRWLGQRLKDRLPAEDVDSIAAELMHLVSPAEAAGGGPLWGIDGVAVVCHGSSRAYQITAAIKEAKLAVESGFIATLREELEKAHRVTSANNHG